VRISLVADNEVIEEMGFEPVDPKSDQVDS